MADVAVVFQARDLNRQGRAMLDAARSGEARVRDKDGTSLLVVPERRFRALTAAVSATANLMAVEQMLDIGPAARSLRDYGDWTWLRIFDDEDLHEFVRDMRDALLVAGREESSALVDETLERWRITAQQLSDPRRRAILLDRESINPDDFVEVGRPEPE